MFKRTEIIKVSPIQNGIKLATFSIIAKKQKQHKNPLLMNE